MKAMILKEHCEIAVAGVNPKIPHLPYKSQPLEPVDLPLPVPEEKQIRIKVAACGICHTELDEIEARLRPPAFPLILGLFGFGASAHIAIQIARYWDCRVFVFTRPGQQGHQDLARKLGAEWVGVTGDMPPAKLDSAIDFTPVGETVRAALEVLEKGGRVVVNAIRKINPVPELSYAEHLWHEKELKSVANVTRQDALEFLPLAAQIGIKPEVREFDLAEVNEALVLLKQGKIHGAGVLRIPD